MSYYNAPEVFHKFLERSKWDLDYSKEMDPYFLRDPLCRINGDWDPAAIKIPKTDYEVIDRDWTIKQQTFSGLKAEDRWDEGLLTDQPTLIQKIANCLPLGDRFRHLIHVQRPGQMHMWHIDPVYGNGIWDDITEEEKQERLVRFFVMLDDWRPGQIIMFGSKVLRWQKGDVIYFRWQDVPHGTANFGHHERPMLQLTGERTQELDAMLADPTIKEYNLTKKGEQ
jgi:hypothetical protein